MLWPIRVLLWDVFFEFAFCLLGFDFVLRLDIACAFLHFCIIVFSDTWFL